MRAREPTSRRHSFQTMSGTIQKYQGMHPGLRRASAEPTAHPRPLRQACWIWPPRLRGRGDFTQLTPPCVEACAFTSWVDPCPGQLKTVGLPTRRPLSLPDLHKAVR